MKRFAASLMPPLITHATSIAGVDVGASGKGLYDGCRRVDLNNNHQSIAANDNNNSHQFNCNAANVGRNRIGAGGAVPDDGARVNISASFRLVMDLDEFLEQNGISKEFLRVQPDSGLLAVSFSPNDIALATNPGTEIFDPAVARFSEDELKPQPILSKSRKQHVPDVMKDQRYWARRAKNNVAAKRSREARRVKENQIVLRASYLEKENEALRVALERMTEENEKLRQMMNNGQN